MGPWEDDDMGEGEDWSHTGHEGFGVCVFDE